MASIRARIVRRTRTLALIGLGVVVASYSLVVTDIGGTRLSTQATAPLDSQRAVYHLTPPAGWLSDPQRPIHVGGQDQLYYLHSAVDNGPGGWRRATTTDNVVFDDHGYSLPLSTRFPVWTGSSVVDTANTAGFGAGAVVALATQPTDGDPYQQEQYLWYSTDEGVTFTKYGAPVITNQDSTNWFRDPKIEWNAATSSWIAVIGEHQQASFWTSPDLKNWTYKSDFAYTSPNIGGFECPDLFRIKADDNSWHWVLGASMQGDYTGKPDTYAYWTGAWNGTSFVPDETDPQWLDWGWDWYAGVSWPDASAPDTRRHAIAWMNNWTYAPHPIKTDVSDGYNGQMSVVRDLTMKARSGGVYSLLSEPTPGLDDHVARTWMLPTKTVNGQLPLEYHGAAYEISADLSWSAADNLGIAVGVSADKDHKTNVGYFGGNLYVDRGPSDYTQHAFGALKQSEAPVGTRTSISVRILVDRSSVEVFTDDGLTAISNQVMFDPNDTGVMLYSSGGSTEFSNIRIREFEDVTTASNPSSAYAGFESTGYPSGWTTSGTAFGSGPSAGALSGQQPVTGFEGSKLANSFHGGDSTTGTLTSPSFTVDEDYLNVLVGGGRNPAPSNLFAGFESSGLGAGWTTNGDLSGLTPVTASLPNQVGSKVLDTYDGSDSHTGAVRSPEFTIIRDYIDFLLAGGDNPYAATRPTAVNLVVDNVVLRSATGNDSSTLDPVSWDVHELIGRKAHLEIVDHATGSWGHLMVDQILFSDVPAATVGEADDRTTVELVVGGDVVRSTTGQDSEHLAWTAWDVRDLVGQSAQLRVVDNGTGSWGHVTVDEVSFDGRPAS